MAATTSYGYDGRNQLTSLRHGQGANDLAHYVFTYDALGRIGMATSKDGTAEYSYDQAGQLVGAAYNYSAAAQAHDESYAYDANGNRIVLDGTGVRTDGAGAAGAQNRPQTDGTYAYLYDAEGNRTRRTHLGTGDYEKYGWDNRNRLISVTHFSVDETQLWTVSYKYDYLNRMVARTEQIGAGTATTESYVYDGEDMILRLDANGTVLDRYLWGPTVDMLLADEQRNAATGDYNVLWALGDHQNSVRDWVDYDPTTQTSVVVDHDVYSAFGEQFTSDNPATTDLNDSAITELFSWTGRYRDPLTGMQWNRARWYDPGMGQWLSEDPIGFGAGDANTRRYTGNDPINRVDPSGLEDLRVAPLNVLGLDAVKEDQERRREFDRQFEAKQAFLNHVHKAFEDPGPNVGYDLKLDRERRAKLGPDLAARQFALDALNWVLFTDPNWDVPQPILNRCEGVARTGGATLTFIASAGASSTLIGATVGVPGMAWSADQWQAGVRGAIWGEHVDSIGANVAHWGLGDGTAGNVAAVGYDVLPAFAAGNPTGTLMRASSLLPISRNARNAIILSEAIAADTRAFAGLSSIAAKEEAATRFFRQPSWNSVAQRPATSIRASDAIFDLKTGIAIRTQPSPLGAPGKTSGDVLDQMDRITQRIAQRMGIGDEWTVEFNYFQPGTMQRHVAGARIPAESIRGGEITIDYGIFGREKSGSFFSLPLRERIEVALTHEVEEASVVYALRRMGVEPVIGFTHNVSVQNAAMTNLRIQPSSRAFLLHWSHNGPYATSGSTGPLP